MNIWDNHPDPSDPNYHPELDDSGAPPIEEPRQRAASSHPMRRTSAPVNLPPVEELMEEMTDDEDEDADHEAALSDARLRLEMGRLYEMVMQSDLFNNLDADAQAIKNVQRQIKRFAKEQMEVMLGMRSAKTETTQVVSPFNELEIDVLKKLAYTATKGASASGPAPKAHVGVSPSPAPQAAPKAKSLTPIGKTNTVATPVKAPTKLASKPAAPVARKPMQKPTAPAQDSDPLDKPISEMNEDELAARNAEAALRQANRKAALPLDRVPMMAPEQANAMYTTRAQTDPNAAAVSTIVNLLNQQK